MKDSSRDHPLRFKRDSIKTRGIDIKVDRALCLSVAFRLNKREDSPVHIQPLAETFCLSAAVPHAHL